MFGRAAVMLSVLASCASAPAARNTALADRMTDCSQAFASYVQTVRETGDAQRIQDAERLYPMIGYFVVAGRVLSSEQHAERRNELTRERYVALRGSIPADYPDDVRRRRFLDALSVDMAECGVIRSENASALDASVKRYLSERSPSAP